MSEGAELVPIEGGEDENYVLRSPLWRKRNKDARQRTAVEQFPSVELPECRTKHETGEKCGLDQTNPNHKSIFWRTNYIHVEGRTHRIEPQPMRWQSFTWSSGPTTVAKQCGADSKTLYNQDVESFAELESKPAADPALLHKAENARRLIVAKRGFIRRGRRLDGRIWLKLPSRSKGGPDGYPIQRSAYLGPEYVFPRGIQIPARTVYALAKGFYYPPHLGLCGIQKRAWQAFARDITSHIPRLNDPTEIPDRLEELLDKVAKWDKLYFRPRGVLMRLDMPGEHKYGLHCMDIFHAKAKHFNNLLESLNPPSNAGKIKLKTSTTVRNRWKVFSRSFCNVRIVLESETVLQDQERAHAHGWFKWLEQCKMAELLLKKEQTQECATQRNQSGVTLLPQKTCDTNCERLRSHPEFFTCAEKRTLRWPPSKLFFYERFRGVGDSTGLYCGEWFETDVDSMDQRGSTRYRQEPVLACDDMVFQIVRADKRIQSARGRRGGRNRRLVTQFEPIYGRAPFLIPFRSWQLEQIQPLPTYW